MERQTGGEERGEKRKKEKERIARGGCCFPLGNGRVTVVAVASLAKGGRKGK